MKTLIEKYLPTDDNLIDFMVLYFAVYLKNINNVCATSLFIMSGSIQ